MHRVDAVVPEAELDVRMDRQLALDSAHQSERENMPAPEEILRELDLDLFFDENHLYYGHGFVQGLPKSGVRAGFPIIARRRSVTSADRRHRCTRLVAPMLLSAHAHPGKNAGSLGKAPPSVVHADGRTRIVLHKSREFPGMCYFRTRPDPSLVSGFPRRCIASLTAPEHSKAAGARDRRANSPLCGV